MHHYFYFVSVMFADHSALYAEKWSNRPLVVDHIMLVMKMRSSSPANRPQCKENLCACTKEKITKKNNKKKSGYLQPAVSSDWRKPAVNGYCPKKKKKVVFISRPIKGLYALFLQDYTASH